MKCSKVNINCLLLYKINILGGKVQGLDILGIFRTSLSGDWGM